MVRAIREAGVDETVLAFQRQQLLPRIAEGSANKVWFVPTDVAGALKGVAEATGLGVPEVVADPPRAVAAPVVPLERDGERPA